MSYKILVLEGVTERGLEILSGEGWTIDTRKATPPEELAKIIAPYHALLLRSGSRITAEVLDAAENLRVIGRPGVGVDNVDLKAATRRGVVVMNSPQGNMVSTAELALALMLGLARNIAPADAAMKSQKWDRKSFKGIELRGKRLGIVGLGRVGRELAVRAQALGMDVVAFDPYVSTAMAEEIGVRMLTFDELLPVADFISLHTGLTPDTRHLLGKEALGKVKPGVRIVNAARGALIDDEALLEALESGRVAGAALDVYAKEPPVDWRLATHPRVLATPHVGASTFEAQEAVGTDVAQQVRDYLKGGTMQNAVNFFALSGDLYEKVKPAMELARRLGALLAQACPGKIERVELGLYGELRELEVKLVLSAAMSGVLDHALDQKVTLVNALSLAEEQGIEVVESTSTAEVGFSNLLVMRLKTGEAELSVAGTLFGSDHLRLVDVDGIEVDAIPRGHLLLIRNEDAPGVIGRIGTLLGSHSVNIARMTVGRKPGSSRAVMVLEVDSEVSQPVLEDVGKMDGIREVKAISLD